MVTTTAALTPTEPADNYDGVWSKYSPSFYSGYVGCWYVRTGTPEASNAKGLRCWKRIDGDGDDAGLKQWNVYNHNIDVLRPKLREHDGNYDHQFHYGVMEKDTAPYDPVIRDAPARKLLKIAPEGVIQLQSTLPPARTAADGPSPPWYSEVFIYDGEAGYRWSCVLGYAATGPLMAVSFISEQWHQLDDPGAPLDFEQMQTPEQRTQLPEDPCEWLPKEAWSSGTACGLYVQSDGSIWRTTEPAAATWDPAAFKDAPGRQLRLLPDSMYLSVPDAVPNGGSGQGMRWEFGGRMRRDANAFARVVMVYGESGRLQSVVHERFTSSA